MLAQRLEACRLWKARHLFRFLQRHRQAEERRALAGREPAIRRGGFAPAALERLDDYRVQRGVEAPDAFDVQIVKLDGGNTPRAQRLEHRGRRREARDVRTPLPRRTPERSAGSRTGHESHDLPACKHRPLRSELTLSANIDPYYFGQLTAHSPEATPGRRDYGNYVGILRALEL